MQIFVVVEDDSEWEDLSVFLTLNSAQKEVVEHVRKTILNKKRWHKSSDDFDYFHIETFEGSGDKLEPVYASFRLRMDTDFERWKEWILMETEDYGQFFRLLEQ